jgi:hypothetical protein
VPPEPLIPNRPAPDGAKRAHGPEFESLSLGIHLGSITDAIAAQRVTSSLHQPHLSAPMLAMGLGVLLGWSWIEATMGIFRESSPGARAGRQR